MKTVIPAKAGIQMDKRGTWILASARMVKLNAIWVRTKGIHKGIKRIVKSRLSYSYQIFHGLPY
jgi:hypothetical protein